MALAIYPERCSVSIDDDHRVEICVVGPFKNAQWQHHVQLASNPCEMGDSWMPVNWLGPLQFISMLVFTEVVAFEQLGNQNDIGATRRSSTHEALSSCDI